MLLTLMCSKDAMGLVSLVSIARTASGLHTSPIYENGVARGLR